SDSPISGAHALARPELLLKVDYNSAIDCGGNFNSSNSMPIGNQFPMGHSTNTRFAPKATELLRRSDPPLCAMRQHMALQQICTVIQKGSVPALFQLLL